MVRGASAREECPNDILITLLEGEKGFEQIVKTFKDKYSRGTINKYLNELFESGLVTRKGRRGPYSLTPKGKEEAEKIRSDIKLFEESKTLSLQEKKRLIKEIERLKRLNRIRELESVYANALPLWTVVKKLVDEYGFKIEDFYDRRRLKDSELQQILQHFRQNKFDLLIHPDRLINCVDLPSETLEPSDIEIKLIPEAEASKIVMNRFKLYHYLQDEEVEPDIVFVIPIHEALGAACGLGWVSLTEEPINGYFIVGAHKELLQLYMEQFEDDWLKWKEEFKLSDGDWKRIGPLVAIMMIDGAPRVNIECALYEYVQSMKPDGLEKLTQTYMRWSRLKKSTAEKMAEDTIEFMERLRRRPIEKIWKEFEENVTSFDERWQRVFQYLKAKYGPC